MDYNWLIDRGEKVAQKIGIFCADDGLDKYEKIALMFRNSAVDSISQQVWLSEEDCSKIYNIIHRLCSIPGVGVMAYPTGLSEKPGFKIRQTVCASSYIFMDDPSFYYSLGKKLVTRNIFLSSVQIVQYYGCVLRYAEVSNDFREPSFETITVSSGQEKRIFQCVKAGDTSNEIKEYMKNIRRKIKEEEFIKIEKS